MFHDHKNLFDSMIIRAFMHRNGQNYDYNYTEQAHMQFLYALSLEFLSSANGTNYIIKNRFAGMIIHALMHDCSNEDGQRYDHARADSH